jgi:chromatin remodeling complex protein RSC6
LWIKILSKNEGDEVRSKFEYIRTRARDIEMEESALNEKQKEQSKEYSPNDNIDNFQNKKESSMEVLDFTPSIEFMPMKLPKNNDSNGSVKLLIPSVALSVVVGAVPMQRTEVISKIWVYIKGHNLQDANNRRKIIADDNLRKIFGKSEFTLFEMAQLVNKHLK